MIILILFVALWLGLLTKTNYLVFGALALLLFLFCFKRFSKRLSILALSVFIIGIGLSHINIEYNKNEYNVMVIESKENYYLVDSFGEKFYVYEKANSKEIGDVLKIKGYSSDIDFTVLESDFDFNKYLNSKGIKKQFKTSSVVETFHNPIRIKKIRTNFLNNFDDETSDFYQSVLFSISNDGTIYTTLKNINVSRLLSLSGLYIYAFIKFLTSFLSRFMKDKKAEIISTSVLVFYSIFTFPKFSVIRILLIRILRLINKYKFDNKISTQTILGFSGIFFLLINRFLAYQDSFLLGYLLPINLQLINYIYIRKKFVKKKLLQMIWIYMFFIPFEAKYSNSINPLGNIIGTILSPIFIFTAFIGLLCFFKIPIYFLGNILVKIINYLVLPFSLFSTSIFLPEFNVILLIIYYLIYYLFAYYISIGFRLIYKPLSIISISLFSLYLLPIKNYITEEVSFINVGQGDCCFIRSGNNTILIDTGGLTYKDVAKSCLIPFLRSKRIYNIDLVITTHDDYDHSGSLESLKENFTVRKTINNYQNFPLEISGITFTNYNNYIPDYSEENEQSLVIGFSLMNLDFLITGDAPISIEKEIMADYDYIPCDILKVGHHGSDTSTSDSFVKYLSPKEAVISVGKNNIYKHPHESVLKILKKNNVKIKRTDQNGTITYSNYKFL